MTRRDCRPVARAGQDLVARRVRDAPRPVGRRSFGRCRGRRHSSCMPGSRPGGGTTDTAPRSRWRSPVRRAGSWGPFRSSFAPISECPVARFLGGRQTASGGSAARCRCEPVRGDRIGRPGGAVAWRVRRRLRPSARQSSSADARPVARTSSSVSRRPCSISRTAGRRSTGRRRPRRSGTSIAGGAGNWASSGSSRFTSPESRRSSRPPSRRRFACTCCVGKVVPTAPASSRPRARASTELRCVGSRSRTSHGSSSSTSPGGRSRSTTTSRSRAGCTFTASVSTLTSPATPPASSTRSTRSRPPQPKDSHRVEFLGGAERYKVELADGFDPLCHGLGLARGLRARALVEAQLAVIRLRLRLKESPGSGISTSTGSRHFGASPRARETRSGHEPAPRRASRGARRPAAPRSGCLGMKRTRGPNRCAAAKPTKSTPGSVERNQRSRSGHPSSSSMPARISGERKESRSSAKRKPAATMTASASRIDPSLRARRAMPSLRSRPVTATPSVTRTTPSTAGRSHGEPPARKTRAVSLRRKTAGSRASRSGMQDEPVQRRRAVADDRIREAIQPLADSAALPVRLAIGEPAKARAYDDLHVGAGARGERRTLETALASADDHDATRP